MLKFSNEEHFDAYLNYLSKSNQDLDNLEASLGFNSTRQAFRSNPANSELELPFEDEYFSTLLNTDNMIAVGSWIFKLNPSLKRVYALSASKLAKFPLLRSETADLDIATFSFDDDVFYLLSDNSGGSSTNTNCSASKIADGNLPDWKLIHTVINTEKTKKTEEYIKGYYKYNGIGLIKTLYINFYHKETRYTNKGTATAPIWGSATNVDVAVKHEYTDTWATHVKGTPFWNSGAHNVIISTVGGKITGTSAITKSHYQSDWYVGRKCLATYKLNASLFFESSTKDETVYEHNFGSIEGN